MKKLGALLIDYIILILVMFALYIVVSITSGMVSAIITESIEEVDLEKTAFISRKIMVYLSLLIIFFYYGQPFNRYAQTIGDKIMKIRIMPEERKKIGVWYGLLRTFCLAPILAIIGLMPASRDPYKSVLDYICRTRTEGV